jgi:endoglucanase
MDIKELLKELTLSFSIGHINGAREILGRVVSQYAKVKEIGDQGLVATIHGNGEKTVLIEAHVDEIGFTVTNVDDNGFLTVASCGGIDLRQLPTKQVVIHGKEKVKGVFISTPPHLSKDNEKFSDISKIKIDTGLNAEAKKVIKVGDYVTFDGEFFALGENRVTSKSLDNRAGCAVLCLLAERLNGKKLPVNVKLLFSEGEELGLRGARTAAFGIEADEAVIVDVSFGDAPDVKAQDSSPLGSGVMIGASPVLSRKITRTLEDMAKENGIPFTNEIMGSTTGTNADVISIVKEGIPCGLASIPLRNMHTDCEIVDLRDVLATVDLLYKYILSGGAKND